MKSELHPTLHQVQVHCQCGNEFVTKSTKQELRVEVCSECHPFWTGKQRLMDSEGRVDKFNRKYAPKPVVEKAPKVKAETPKPVLKKKTIEKKSSGKTGASISKEPKAIPKLIKAKKVVEA